MIQRILDATAASGKTLVRSYIRATFGATAAAQAAIAAPASLFFDDPGTADLMVIVISGQRRLMNLMLDLPSANSRWGWANMTLNPMWVIDGEAMSLYRDAITLALSDDVDNELVDLLHKGA